MNLVTTSNFKSFLTELNSHHGFCGFLAGGTNIMMDEKRGTNDKKTIFNISAFKNELDYVNSFEEYIEVGALTTISDLIKNHEVHLHLPQLVKSLNSIGSVQVRNMGTLAGNLANASSIGDAIPVLLTLDTQINAISIDGERRISINEFFVDYKKTSLRENEIIKSIFIPKNKYGGKYDFFKIAVRPTATISKLNMAYSIEGSNVKIAAGGMSKVTTRLLHVEKLFSKKGFKIADFEEALNKDVQPISDKRSTSDYRKKVLLNLIFSIYSL